MMRIAPRAMEESDISELMLRDEEPEMMRIIEGY